MCSVRGVCAILIPSSKIFFVLIYESNIDYNARLLSHKIFAASLLKTKYKVNKELLYILKKTLYIYKMGSLFNTFIYDCFV